MNHSTALLSLTQSQARCVDHAVRAIEAGPGSGKTRCLVARFRMHAGNNKSGVAYISYTNAAVEEVKSRIADQPHLLQAPNFVGTIDSFIRTFIVTPYLGRMESISPVYYLTWDDLPLSDRSIAVPVTTGGSILLSHFRLLPDFTAQIQNPTSGSSCMSYLTSVTAEGKLNELKHVARERLLDLYASGVFDTASSRMKASHILRSTGSLATISPLAMRFSEIIVDEAQDCDEFDFDVISSLSEHIPTVIAADSDQSIFGFRGGSSKYFQDYKSALRDDQVLYLDINHRSTKSICAAVQSLRSPRLPKLVSADTTDDIPVYVTSAKLDAQKHVMHALAEKHSIAYASCVALAYSLADARAAAGVTAGMRIHAASSLAERAASAVRDFTRSSGDGAIRLRARNQIRHLIASVFEWPTSVGKLPLADQLSSASRSMEWLNVLSAITMCELEKARSSADFSSSLEHALVSACVGVGLPTSHIAGLCSLSHEMWVSLLAIDGSPAGQPTMRYSTIHSAKGTEHEAVLLALSPRDAEHRFSAVDAWDGKKDTTERRILYVGASRATRLLLIGAGPQSSRVAAILCANGVNHCMV